MSEHTKAMRQALEACQTLLSQTLATDSLDVAAHGVNNNETDETAASLSLNVQKLRQEALRDFTAHLRHDPNFDANIPNINLDSDSSDDAATMEAWQFRKDYHQANLPCRIPTGLLSKKYFSYVEEYWSSPQKFRQWIREAYQHQVEKNEMHHHQELHEKDANGSHLFLPVRRVAVPCREDSGRPLDEDGRANECATVKMTLDEWIAYLDAQKQAATIDGSDVDIVDASKDEEKDYLKDWHFESWLETHHFSNNDEHEKNDSSPTPRPPLNALYKLPNFFEYDLLNPFLLTFTGGDYRFVYWGPAKSRTDWHSDVLHSFSWSYNVYGRKEWTFVVPSNKQHNQNQHDNDNNHQSPPPRQIKMIQRAGECVFVPAKWQHQVVNLEETLSINRNWITAANLDLCFDCLLTEIRSIEKELAAWKTEYDWEARESMLRGCVGLVRPKRSRRQKKGFSEIISDTFVFETGRDSLLSNDPVSIGRHDTK